MRIGTLRDRIGVFKPVKTRDETGQSKDVLRLVCERFANVLFITGRETIKSERENYQPTASCRIRPMKEITTEWQVMYRGEMYEVITLLPQRTYTDLVIRKVAYG